MIEETKGSQGDFMRRRTFIAGVGALSLAAVASAVPSPQAGVSPGPGSNPAKLEVHPGWVRSGVDNAPGHKAYYINLEAKPGKGDKVEQFLRDILAGVEQEPGTGPWFGCRFSDTTFGIFEAFPDSAARDAHDGGPGGRNFLRSEVLDEMLAYPAHLYRLDVMFGKFSVMFGQKITSQ